MIGQVTIVISLIFICLFSTAAKAWALSNLDILKSERAASNAYDNGEYSKALFYNKQALVLNPKDPRILVTIGSALGELGNYSGAITFFKKALAVDPRWIGALVGIGDTLEKLGNNSTAMIFFKEAIAQHPEAEFEQTERAMALVYLGNYS